jgi:predicted CoA-substrate-specific enzyme activase
MNTFYMGIDVGSTTVKVAVLDRAKRLVASRYVQAQGRPRKTLARVLRSLSTDGHLTGVVATGLSGSGGGTIAQQAGLRHINELVAQTRAVSEYHPDARTVIEIGGQDSKLLILERDPHTGQSMLVDFGMNTLCAAGTGSFLDQQAERLDIRIEDEFAALALQAEQPASIAGRCTVFAKTDMIHLQQRGATVPEIVAGLCYALTRNFKSVIGRGKPFERPILFQGGVACNQAVVRAFEDVLDLAPGELIIPEYHRLMAALGVGLTLIDEAEAAPAGSRSGRQEPSPFDLHSLLTVLEQALPSGRALPPLRGRDEPFHWQPPSLNGDGRLLAYLGIDVGSISTNVVLIDGDQHLIARRYLRTAGRPLEAVKQGLLEVGQEVGGHVTVRGVGVTGSGRYLTGAYVGADVVRNEITAQARAAVALDPTVDTVFEIGGQDSKYIQLREGVVVDFAMNKACAAGTGSFLEEQAERLDIDIERDFGRLALCAAAPASLGERCTVFMESDLVHCQQQGAPVPDLTAGLAYSIAQNYLNRVVNGRAVGEHVFFQGGVASNQGVVAAFRQLTGTRVTVPSHHDVSGAIGAAILALEADGRAKAHDAIAAHTTRFQGFDLRERTYETRSLTCQGCVNHCEITRVDLAGERPLFYGARCDRYEGRRGEGEGALPDLFALRSELLMQGYQPPVEGSGRPRVGLPRALLFYDLFPYWHRFLVELGADVVLSDVTNPRILQETREHTPAETCFPVKLMQGHALDLMAKGVDYLFLPSVTTRGGPAPGQGHNKHCPFIQAAPHLVVNSLCPGRDATGVGALSGPVDFLNPRTLHRELCELVWPLGALSRQVQSAQAAAEQAQRAFSAGMQAMGTEFLADLDRWERIAVLVGRPYNTCDPGVSMALPYKLRALGVVPMPMDCLPLAEVDVSDRFDNMYWHSGQAILAAGRLIAHEPRLQAIYVTNFGCGPDSFLLSFFQRIMDGKVYLELELDDHTADAGVNTRCEAFFDSLAAQGAWARV